MTESIPVTIISGFLGAGKTTLINNLLEDPGGERLGILVNDFGNINIDQKLIDSEAGNQIDLTNGCVCCTIQDDLASALVQLLGRSPDLTRIVVECSGISNPLGVLKIFEWDSVSRISHPESIFALVDASTFAELDFVSTELAIDQAAASDIVFLNKTDLVPEETWRQVSATLLEAQRSMRIVPVERARIDAGLLFGQGEPAFRDRPELERETRAGTHEDLFESEAYCWPEAIELAKLEEFARALPDSVLRAKGIFGIWVDGAAESRRCVLQRVGRRTTISVDDRSWPEGGEIVLLARCGDLVPEALRQAFDAAPGSYRVRTSMQASTQAPGKQL